MSGRPPAQERPGFIKVCLCPEEKQTSTGRIVRRDLTYQCSVCHGFAALERCPDCEDRGALSIVGRALRNKGRLSVFTCETCKSRGYRRTDRKVDAYAQKPKEPTKKKKRRK